MVKKVINIFVINKYQMSDITKLFAELLPLYFSGDFQAILNKLVEPQNISTFVSYVSEKLDGENSFRQESMSIKKERLEILKEISGTLKSIEQAMCYAPDGKGYLETKKDFEGKVHKKRKIRDEE